MRFILPTVASVCLLTLSAPAFAQSVSAEQLATATSFIESKDISDTAYKNGWCGAAFSILADMMTEKGDKDSATQLLALQDVLFDKAGTELQEAGMSEEDMTTFGGSIYFVARSQTEADDGSAAFTKEECLAAAQAE